MSEQVKLSKSRIQELRIQRCWSQDELASASGLSIRTIQRVEKTGNASLETVKALSSVFEVEPAFLQDRDDLQSVTFKFICKYAWLVAFALSSAFFGLWIIDILIPTLKGADFNNQYEIHGNFRYLDYGGLSFIAGFLLLGINVALEFMEKRKPARSHVTE